MKDAFFEIRWLVGSAFPLLRKGDRLEAARCLAGDGAIRAGGRASVEGFDQGVDLKDIVGGFEHREIEVVGGECLEVKVPIQGHERVDEELAIACSFGAMGISEAAFEGGEDAAVDDALSFGHLGMCVFDGLSKSRHFGHGEVERVRSEVAALGIEGCDILQDMGMTDAVKGIDPKSQAANDLGR